MHKVLKDVKHVFSEVCEDSEGLNLDGLQDAMKLLKVNMTKEEIADLFGFIDLDGSLRIEIKEFLVALTIGMVLDVIPAFGGIASSRVELDADGHPILGSPAISPTMSLDPQHNPTNVLSNPTSTYISPKILDVSGKRQFDFLINQQTTIHRKNHEIKDMLGLIVSAYLLFDPEGKGFILKGAVEKMLEESGHTAGKNAMLSQDKWKEMVSIKCSCVSHYIILYFVLGCCSDFISFCHDFFSIHRIGMKMEQ